MLTAGVFVQSKRVAVDPHKLLTVATKKLECRSRRSFLVTRLVSTIKSRSKCLSRVVKSLTTRKPSVLDETILFQQTSQLHYSKNPASLISSLEFKARTSFLFPSLHCAWRTLPRCNGHCSSSRLYGWLFPALPSPCRMKSSLQAGVRTMMSSQAFWWIPAAQATSISRGIMSHPSPTPSRLTHSQRPVQMLLQCLVACPQLAVWLISRSLTPTGKSHPPVSSHRRSKYVDCLEGTSNSCLVLLFLCLNWTRCKHHCPTMIVLTVTNLIPPDYSHLVESL